MASASIETALRTGGRERMAFLALCGAFFLSGAAALIDQIVWQRMLGMFAGSDSVTAALVVGAFLLGLGLGSLAAGNAADALGVRRSLLGFVLCEIGIGGFAMLSRPFLYDFVVGVLGPHMESGFAIFAICFLGILVPTFLMGASLPLLAKAAVRSLQHAAARIGALYGLNTVGAGLGALIAGWWLVGNLGYEGALAVAATLNLAAALLAGVVLWGYTASAAEDAPPPIQAAASEVTGSFGFVTWALLVFVSGFCIVGLEILWVRVAGVIAQYTAYSFATILGTFLLADGLGIVLGAWWVRRLKDTRGPFLIVQALAVGYALLSFHIVYFLADDAWWQALLAAETSRHYGASLGAALLASIAFVAPPSLLLGMSFPLVQKAVQTDLARLGARVGYVQVANILGNAAGSLVTGLAALHWLGSAGTMRLIAVLAIVLLALWCWTAWRERRPAWRGSAALAAMLLLVLLALPGNARFWSRLHQVPDGAEALLAEDRSGLAVFRLEAGSSPFFIQGFTQSKWPFMKEHMFLGALGPMLHAAPKDVLVIGSGSGGTPFAAGINPATERVRVVELVGPVFAVLRRFADQRPESAIGRLLADPRYDFVVGDGRRAIFAGGRRYDVIQADAILPESSHSGLLYSVEFMRHVLAALKDDGLYVQWGPTARSVATFAAVFPHAVLLSPFPVLIGSRQPIELDAARLDALFGTAGARTRFMAAGLDSTGARRFYHGAVRHFGADGNAGEAQLNGDLFPRDEYYINNRLGAATN